MKRKIHVFEPKYCGICGGGVEIHAKGHWVETGDYSEVSGEGDS